MASCIGCKKRTTSFCYRHRCSVCDDCSTLKAQSQSIAPIQSNTSTATPPTALPSVPCVANCPIGNYFSWLADGDFTYPPRCSLCSNTITSEGSDGVVRLVCKCMFHRQCMVDSIQTSVASGTSTKDLTCPSCSKALIDLVSQPRTQLRNAVQALIQEVTKGNGGSGGSIGSSSSSTTRSPESVSSNSTSPSRISSKDSTDDEYVIVRSKTLHAAQSTPIISNSVTSYTTASNTTTSSTASSSSSSLPTPASSISESRYSPAVRALMQQAKAQQAAAAASTSSKHHATTSSSSSSTSSITPSYSPESTHRSTHSLTPGSSIGAVPRPTAVAASAIAHHASSTSSAATSARDLEAQRVDPSDSAGKTHKSRSLFRALRLGLMSREGWRHCLRPQRILLAMMAAALIIVCMLYMMSFKQIMQSEDTKHLDVNIARPD